MFSISEINADEFQRLIFNGTGKIPIFVMFYDPRSSECELPLMSFTDASDEMNDTVKFVTFDIGKDPEFAQKFQIEMIPTFIFFFQHTPVPYDGRRTIKAFKTFAFECVKLLFLQVDHTWQDTDENRVILFSHRKLLPEILVNAYGKYQRKDINFGMTNNKTMASLIPGVKFSSYWFFKGKTAKMEYKGSLEQQSFNKAIEKFFEIPSKTPIPKPSAHAEL